MSGTEIIGVVEQVVSTGLKIYSIYCALRDAPGEVREFCTELQALNQVLTDIRASAIKLQNVNNSNSMGVQSIFVAVKSCEAQFDDIWQVVSPLQSNPGIDWKHAAQKITKSFKWMMKEDGVEKSTRELERLKQGLVLAMLMCGMNTDTTVLESLAFIGSRVEDSGNAVETQVQELEAHLLMNLKQLEHRLFQKVHELSSIATAQHAESDLRITDLSGSIPDAESGSVAMSELWSVELPVTAAASDQSIDPGASDKDKLTPVPDVPPRPVTPQLEQLEKALQFMESRQGTEKTKTVSTVSREALEAGLLPLNELLYKIAHLSDTASTDIRQTSRLVMQLIPKLAQNSNRASLFGDQASQSDSLMMVTIRRFLQLLVLGRSTWMKVDVVESILKVLVEMQDVFETCEREYALYPEPHVKDLVLDLYTEVISSLARITRILPDTTRSAMRLVTIPESNVQMIKDSVETIQACARKVIKEVEYLHRKELRQAHFRLRQIDRKQDQVIRALEEQRRIMLSLQEEQKVLTSVNNHQKVLQMLQQLLADKASTAPEGC